MKPLEKLKPRERGVAVVEFALVLPLLVLILFGIIEFSLILYNKAIITNASREGARSGILYRYPTPTTAQLQTLVSGVVNQYCQNRLISLGGSNTVRTTVIQAGPNPGDPLTVRVDYNYRFLVLPNFVSSLMNYSSQGLPLRAETIMRME